MAFHDHPFPVSIAVGAQIGPTRPLEVVTARSGVEARNLPAAASRRRFTLTVPPGAEDVQEALLHFWEGRRSGLYSFPLRDPADHKSCARSATPAATDQALGTGDGATVAFQLVKTYEPAGPNPWARSITKPVVASVKVALDGVEQLTGWSVARLTGVVTFDVAPGAGVAVTAGYEFDVPVRFEAPELIETILFRDDTLAREGVTEYSDVTLIEDLRA